MSKVVPKRIAAWTAIVNGALAFGVGSAAAADCHSGGAQAHGLPVGASLQLKAPIQMDDSSLVAREWGMPQAAQCVSQPPLRERVRHQRSDAVRNSSRNCSSIPPGHCGHQERERVPESGSSSSLTFVVA